METDTSLRSSPAFTEFADAWTAVPKVVFSRSPLKLRGTAQLATRPLADEVRAALASTEKDVEIGGATLAAQAFELGLIDEVRLFRAPVVLGGGAPFFPPIAHAVRMRLIETRTFEPGIVYERYRVL